MARFYRLRASPSNGLALDSEQFPGPEGSPTRTSPYPNGSRPEWVPEWVRLIYRLKQVRIGAILLVPPPFALSHRWQSGQMHQTVNLAGYALRRFDSYPVQFFLFLSV
jgi:hypothetical protein